MKSSILKLPTLLISVFFISFVTNLAKSQDQFVQINPTKFKNQFDHEIEIIDQTTWILFSNEKEAYELITDYLKSKNINKTKNQNGFYVADISKMPRMIANFFAIPEMQKLPFSILLDRNEQTKSWPKKEKHFTLIKLKSLKVTEVLFIKDKNELEKNWSTLTKD